MTDKDFLHKIATPLTTLQLNVEQALSAIQNDPETDKSKVILELLNGALRQLQKLQSILQEQRLKK